MWYREENRAEWEGEWGAAWLEAGAALGYGSPRHLGGRQALAFCSTDGGAEVRGLATYPPGTAAHVTWASLDSESSHTDSLPHPKTTWAWQRKKTVLQWTLPPPMDASLPRGHLCPPSLTQTRNWVNGRPSPCQAASLHPSLPPPLHEMKGESASPNRADTWIDKCQCPW